MEKVMAGTNVKRTIDRMVSRGTDLGKKLTAMRFFLRADNLAVPKYLLKNEESLEQIHLDILRAGSEV